jgi:hypothetical protein
MLVAVNITVLWDEVVCSLVECYRRAPAGSSKTLLIITITIIIITTIIAILMTTMMMMIIIWKSCIVMLCK